VKHGSSRTGIICSIPVRRIALLSPQPSQFFNGAVMKILRLTGENSASNVHDERPLNVFSEENELGRYIWQKRANPGSANVASFLVG